MPANDDTCPLPQGAIMKVNPFGRGEVYATEFTDEDLNGDVHVSYAVVHMSDSGDRCGIDRGYSTLADAEVAAYLTARKYNAVLIPSTRGQA